MSSDRAPPERPDTPAETDSTDEIDPASETGHGLDNITTEPGRRKTSNVEMLVIEAELVADGNEPDNPAIPVDAGSRRRSWCRRGRGRGNRTVVANDAENTGGPPE